MALLASTHGQREDAVPWQSGAGDAQRALTLPGCRLLSRTVAVGDPPWMPRPNELLCRQRQRPPGALQQTDSAHDESSGGAADT